MGICVENVAYTEFPSTEKTLPPVIVGAGLPVRPRMVSVWVSNKNGPAMNREPSGATERMARKPVTLRLRNTVPEATS